MQTNGLPRPIGSLEPPPWWTRDSSDPVGSAGEDAKVAPVWRQPVLFVWFFPRDDVMLGWTR